MWDGTYLLYLNTNVNRKPCAAMTQHMRNRVYCTARARQRRGSRHREGERDQRDAISTAPYCCAQNTTKAHEANTDNVQTQTPILHDMQTSPTLSPPKYVDLVRLPRSVLDDAQHLILRSRPVSSPVALHPVGARGAISQHPGTSGQNFFLGVLH